MNARKLLRLSYSAPKARDEQGARHDEPSGRVVARLVKTRQPLGLGERTFRSLHRFTATNVCRVITLDGVIAARELRFALHRLQRRHPLLRAKIAEEGTGYFEFDQTVPIRLRAVPRRDDDHWRDVLRQRLNTPIPHTGPLVEVHYLSSEHRHRSELILIGDHTACDEVSLNSLADELLDLATHGWPRLPLQRPPVPDDLLPTLTLGEVGRGLGVALRKFTRVAVQRTFHEERIVGRTSDHAFAQLGQDETMRLVRRARREGTTLTGVLMAAMMLAVRDERPHTPALALSVPVNLRPHLPNIHVRAEDLGNYTTSVYLETDALGGAWELARKLDAQVQRETVERELLASAPLMYLAGARLARDNQPARDHALVSHTGPLGIRRRYGSLGVRGVYSATSAPTVSADFGLFSHTFDGQLGINLVAAREVVPRSVLERVLARTCEVLVGAAQEVEA